jgi:hypothetical protein
LVQTAFVPHPVPLAFAVLTQPFVGSQVTVLQASPLGQLHGVHELLPAEAEYVPLAQEVHWDEPAAE